MKYRLRPSCFLAAGCLSLLVACQPQADKPGGSEAAPTSGSGGGGGAGAGAGGPASGGNGGNAAGAGGSAGAGGPSSTAGQSGQGGGPSDEPKPDAAPSPEPDAGGADAASGMDLAPAAGAPKASAGCGKPKPATLPTTIATEGRQGTVILSVPEAYDPQKPYPLVFGFHGAGLKARDCEGGNCAGLKSVMRDKALLVFMQSFSFNWEGNDRNAHAQFFSDALAYMKTNFCVDESRVVVAGSSSGATFSNILGCRFGDILRVVAPVAGSAPEKQNCKGNPPALVIHGVSDNFNGGQSVRDWYAMRNECGPDTDPNMQAEIQKVLTARQSRTEIHACSTYTTCKTNPVRFCAHSVGGYNGTTHGWPPIGGQLIWDFLQEQK